MSQNKIFFLELLFKSENFEHYFPKSKHICKKVKEWKQQRATSDLKWGVLINAFISSYDIPGKYKEIIEMLYEAAIKTY